MSFERAAAIPEPHVRAEAYLRVAVSRRIANDNGPIIVALPDERRGCAVSAAMAARLDDIGATWIESARRNEDEDDGDAEDERKPSVILGAFDDENDVAALAAVREGGRPRQDIDANAVVFGSDARCSARWSRATRPRRASFRVRKRAWRSALFPRRKSRASRKSPGCRFRRRESRRRRRRRLGGRVVARLGARAKRDDVVAADRDRFGARLGTPRIRFSAIRTRSRTRRRQRDARTASLDHLDADKTFVVTGGLVAARSASRCRPARPSLSRARPPSESFRSFDFVGRRGASAGASARTRTPLDVKRRRTSSVDFASPTYRRRTRAARGRVLRDAMLPSRGGWDSRGVVGEDFRVGSRGRRRRLVDHQLSVMFSSMAALLGSAGQTNYSGANAALDRAASAARETGAVASSVQWGAWGAVGMAAQNEGVLGRIERMGMGVLRRRGWRRRARRRTLRRDERRRESVRVGSTRQGAQTASGDVRRTHRRSCGGGGEAPTREAAGETDRNRDGPEEPPPRNRAAGERSHRRGGSGTRSGDPERFARSRRRARRAAHGRRSRLSLRRRAQTTVGV